MGVSSRENIAKKGLIFNDACERRQTHAAGDLHRIPLPRLLCCLTRVMSLMPGSSRGWFFRVGGGGQREGGGGNSAGNPRPLSRRKGELCQRLSAGTNYQVKRPLSRFIVGEFLSASPSHHTAFCAALRGGSNIQHFAPFDSKEEVRVGLDSDANEAGISSSSAISVASTNIFTNRSSLLQFSRNSSVVWSWFVAADKSKFLDWSILLGHARQSRDLIACLLRRLSGFHPRRGHPGFLHVGIVLDDVTGRCDFSLWGISRFHRPRIPEPLNTHIVPDDAAVRRVFPRASLFCHPCIPALLHIHLASPSSALQLLSQATNECETREREKGNIERGKRGKMEALGENPRDE
ncbi:hypothetical protein PR048_027105 [Dryococelus australis]|uniref:Uncharacterized protein n=1 Tax=Dryococelus australis TaxID=614101 RepID=A0ABQ9GG41_9NEOP|nr:hypothetical protein PR048_027105 [Dryococelus australis]